MLTYGDVEYRTVKKLRVTSNKKTYIQIDGDTFGTLPAEIGKAKDTLRVILPAASKEDSCHKTPMERICQC